MDHFAFNGISSPQLVNSNFSLAITALDTNNQRVFAYQGQISLSATGSLGILAVQPTNSITLSNGLWSGNVSLGSAGGPVRLIARIDSGQVGVSNPFYVEAWPFRMLSQQVDDLVYDPISGAVLATVSSSGDYQDKMLMIDPTTATVTNSYITGPGPGHMEVSPDSRFLYIGVNSGLGMRRFDLNSRTFGTNISFGSNPDGAFVANDFAIVGGMPDSVVVALSNPANYGVVRRYDSGKAVSLSVGGQIYPVYLAGSSSGPQVYAVDPNFGVLGRFSVNPLSGITVTNGILANPGRDFLFVEGILYALSGEAVAGNIFQSLGKYPTSGAMVVEPSLHRTLFIEYPNYSNCRVKAFDRDSFTLLRSLLMPPVTGAPVRLIRWGTNGLAFNTAVGQVWFVQSGLVLPPPQPADLMVTFIPPAPPVMVGSNAIYTLTISNQGPGSATFVQVSNSLPANAVALATSVSSGVVTQSLGALLWTIYELPAGATSSLQFSIIHSNLGWQGMTASAIAYEPDFNVTNNTVSTATFVHLAGEYTGAVSFDFAAQDLIYDPIRDRLLLAVADGIGVLTNSIAVFNPYTGVIEGWVSLTLKPAGLTRSSDGQFLYVSFNDDARVRRLLLPTLTTDIEFGLGGEYIYGLWYPFYAADMATVPDQSGSLAVWRVRRPGPMASAFGQGIAVFDNGVMRSNVTASGGNWAVEFDRDTDTLYGYESGGRTLERFALDPSGVVVAQAFPSLAFNVGNDLKYASGRLFLNTGRAINTNPFGVVGIYSGSEAASLGEVDATNQSVFFLAQPGGWRLNAYGMNTFDPIGSLMLPSLKGTPHSLSRWGPDGLAFCTSSNQLFLIRSPLVQPTSSADVAVTQSGPVSPVTVGSNLTFTFTITNAGPAQATGLILTNTFSPAVSLVASTASAGTWTTIGSNVRWSLPALPLGSNVTASLTVRSLAVGALLSTANLITQTFDPSTSNNTAVAVASIGITNGANSIVSLPLATSDLVYDPNSKRIYASVASGVPNVGDSLLAIEPNSLSFGYPAYLGPHAGKLALSDDATELYAAVDFGLQTIDLPAITKGVRFTLDPLGSSLRVTNMAVLPHSPHSLVVVDNSSPRKMTVFDSGAPRTNASLPGAAVLAAGDNPLMVYVLTSAGLDRYTLDPGGTTLLDSDTTLNPLRAQMDLKWGGGRLFTSRGSVIDPVAKVLLATLPGISVESPFTYDSAVKRVYYLTASGANALLQAFDTTTFLSAGSMAISGLSGTPAGLLRWGPDGFAFRTSGGQLFLLRSSLVPTNPPADVGVSMLSSQAPYWVGSNVTQMIVVTNTGPNDAMDVHWTNLLPSGVSIVGAATTQGVIDPGLASGSLGRLSNGMSATITLQFRSSAEGIVSSSVSVITSSVDFNNQNNSAFATFWFRTLGGTGTTSVLNFTTKDIVLDPSRNRLLASIGATGGALANSILSLDLLNGLVDARLYLGSDPGRLAVSADGRFLYVALDAGRAIQRVELGTMSADFRFATATSQKVLDMSVVPTNSEQVVVRQGNITIYDHGVGQPNQLSGLDLFAFSDVSFDLFACTGSFINVPLYRVELNASGLSLLEGQPGKQGLAREMKFAGGLLYYSRGMVLNPALDRVQAVLPQPADPGNLYNSLVEPDPGSGRIFMLAPIGGGTWALLAFASHQFLECGRGNITGVNGTPTRFLRWGTDGFVFRTDSQLFLSHPNLVPTNPPTDLALSASVSMSDVPVNSPLTYTVTVTNAGPNPAFGIVVTQGFSLAITGLTASASSGVVTTTGSQVTWRLDSLTAASNATLNVQIQPTASGTLVTRAAVRHSANDPRLANNLALAVTRVGISSSPSLTELDIGIRELIYDATRNRIYASIPSSEPFLGNSVIAVVPETAQMQQTFFAGSDPNQLALSDDGRFLYVSLNGTMGARRIDLTAQAPELEFPFSLDEIYNAFDLKVQPGHPNTIGVSRVSTRTSMDYPADVALFDNGLPRSVTAGVTKSIEFSPDGQRIYGSITFRAGFGFLRLAVSPGGVSLIDVDGRFYNDYDLQLQNGLLYSALGRAIDPNIPILVTNFGPNSTVAPDVHSGRIFQIPLSDTTQELRAYAMGSFELLGTLPLSGVHPYVRNLIRCGGDRLAFRTEPGQFFILRTSLVPPQAGPASDLAVGQAVLYNSSPPGDKLIFSVAITNWGPDVADYLIATFIPPAPVAALSLQPSQGACATIDGNLFWQLGSLGVGSIASIQIVATVTNTTTFSNFVSVTSAAGDPVLANNTSLAFAATAVIQPPDSVNAVNLACRDIAYDPNSGRLFASVAGATSAQDTKVAQINPASGLVEDLIEVGPMPNRLALSDDGQFLYVTVATNLLVRRVNLGFKTVDLEFAQPSDPVLWDLAVPPAHPDRLVIVRDSYPGGRPTGIPSLTVYDHGVTLANQPIADYRFTSVEAAPSGGKLYAYSGYSGTGSPELFQLVMDDNGATITSPAPNDLVEVYSGDMKLRGDRLFFGSGQVINPSNWTTEVWFTDLRYAFGSLVEVSPSGDRVFFLSDDGANAVVWRAYNRASQQLLASQHLGNVSGFAGFIWCGGDRLTFRSADRIFIIRTSQIPTTDLKLSVSGFPPSALAGTSVPVSLTVSNAGLVLAGNVIVTNLLTPGASLSLASISQGTWSNTAGGFSWMIGSLAPNSVATLTLTLHTTNIVHENVTNTFAVSGAKVTSFSDDSHHTVVLPLLADNDRDQMPDTWELAHGLDPSNPADASMDSDGDGLTNLQEYLAGTDPKDPTNALRLLQLRPRGNSIELVFNSVAGRTYVIERTDSLNPANWLFITNGLFCCSAPSSVLVPNTTQTTLTFFYRVRLNSGGF